MMAVSVTDRYVVRRLPALARAAGLENVTLASHGYVETAPADDTLTIVDRGIALLRSSGGIGEDAAAPLAAEARRRVDAGAWFGHIAYGSLTATKPR